MINREEWLKALHVKGEAGDMLASQMDEAEKLLMDAAVPRKIYRIMQRAELRLSGVSIERHLEDCEKVAVMAATLGIGVDNLIRRYQVKDMAMAVILDAGASVYIEQVCDGFEAEIGDALGADGCGNNEAAPLFMTPRFSPGYGDYPITEQKYILSLVDAPRRIGLNATADSLMIPRKSVSALIGLADHPVKGKLATCSECVLREKCLLRKEGKFCGN